MKSKKQMNFMKAAAGSALKNIGPSPEVAKKILSHESKKKKLMS